MLELSANPSLAPGTYPLKVQGTNNGVTKEAPLTLEVRTSSTANLRILKAEWGQTVLKQNLRLVAGKEALLRVHLVAAPSALSLSQPLAGAVYQGSAFVGNLSFTCPNPIPTTTAQGDLSTTCNATLPWNWVASRPQGGTPGRPQQPGGRKRRKRQRPHPEPLRRGGHRSLPHRGAGGAPVATALHPHLRPDPPGHLAPPEHRF
jgi:hypothetical protein